MKRILISNFGVYLFRDQLAKKENPLHVVLINDIITSSASSSRNSSPPISVPEDLDAYTNASKTVLKQGEPLTVNCTVHGVELASFSWDIPNREVSRSEAIQALLFCSPFTSTQRPLDRTQIASRCRDTPQFYSPVKFLFF